MSLQPYNLLAGLPPLAPRMAGLPIDDFGFPVPFSVDRAASTPMSRVVSKENWTLAHRGRLCWTCGKPLGRHVTFLVSASATVNRITDQLPSHLDCAMWNASTLKASDGVCCLWTTHGTAEQRHGYTLFRHPDGRTLLEISKPVTVSWWFSGRAAMRSEILRAIQEGNSELGKICHAETSAKHCVEANRRLDEKLELAFRLVPLSTPPHHSHPWLTGRTFTRNNRRHGKQLTARMPVAFWPKVDEIGIDLIGVENAVGFVLAGQNEASPPFLVGLHSRSRSTLSPIHPSIASVIST